MRFVAGAAAGATATTLTYPLESLGWAVAWVQGVGSLV